jgi:hypothetical protein
MPTGQFTTKYIHSTSEVPAGYVPLSHYGDADTKKIVSKAHCQGLIPAVKLCRHKGEERTGPVWLSKPHTDEFLANYNRRAISEACGERTESNRHAVPESVDQFLGQLSLAESTVVGGGLRELNASMATIAELLERLATAAENIATQPKTPQQELLQQFSTNGFHS